MSSNSALILQERSADSYAGRLLSFGDMIDCPSELHVHLEGQSAILDAYNLLGRLTKMINDGNEIKVVKEHRLPNGRIRIMPGRDYMLFSKCLAFNDYISEQYDVLPDMRVWLDLICKPEFSLLKSVLPARGPLEGSLADRLKECCAQYQAIITSIKHRKRCYNVAVNARRRHRSITKPIEECLRLHDNISIELIQMFWNPSCRMRKTLDDTDVAYGRFANAIRHNSVSNNLLVAVFCVELSDEKRFHISGLLVFAGGRDGQAADVGRYWTSHATAGQGSFLCATDMPFDAMLAKWSGLPIEEIASLGVRQGDHARQQLIEATVTHFARFSQKLRAKGAGRKHRQLRIFSSNQSGGRRQAALPVKGWGGADA